MDDVLRVGAAHDIGEALLQGLRLRLLLRGDKGLDGARWLVVADAASWRRRRLVGDHAHFGNASCQMTAGVPGRLSCHFQPSSPLALSSVSRTTPSIEIPSSRIAEPRFNGWLKSSRSEEHTSELQSTIR